MQWYNGYRKDSVWSFCNSEVFQHERWEHIDINILTPNNSSFLVPFFNIFFRVSQENAVMLLMVRSQGQIASINMFLNPSPCSWFYFMHFCDLVCIGKYIINCALWNFYSLTENFSKHTFNNRLDGGLKKESICF